MYQTLISVEELQQNSSSQGWVVVDCRFDLADPSKGYQLYREGHIPHAQFMDLEEDLSSPIASTSGRHPLPDLQKFKEKLGKAGITARSQVVIYDDCSGAMASRLWWLLRCLGHEAVAVLDGGFPVWKQQVGEISTNVFLPVKEVYQEVGVNTDLHDGWKNLAMSVISSEKLFRSLADVQLVDARVAPRFNGEVEPIDPVAGHVPGALNRPFVDNLTAAGIFKPADQLAKEWSALVDVDKSVVHMCGSGVTACHNILAMMHAGMTNTVLYAGSWSEWIRDSQRPVSRL
ncbi:sulfurtransferase [Neptunomonas japonica]|uniref:sulfurtransferase n=1 Tax=Neptunomonas japonica TaxID=417574 RepID=UPI000407163B|nr:sulfurtransferase [Neptunomonas japonica]